MNRITYDVSMLVGSGLATAGVAVMWGAGPALLAAGGLVIGLTLVGALLGGKR